MQNKDERREWDIYLKRELQGVLPILKELRFELEHFQPHVIGERYIMRAVTTEHGKKLILLGKRKCDGKRVVIKATSDPSGKRELLRERTCRKVLHAIHFAYDGFLSPEEIMHLQKGKYVISIHSFIEQKCPFLERPLEEQFFLALKAFKAQESAHAATYEQRRIIESTFGSQNAKGYLSAFKKFRIEISALLSKHADTQNLLKTGEMLLKTNCKTIDQYSRFLTHIDFVPHNFRIVDKDIYLLDHSSLRFGNKYEGWARFLNFMALYNPPLTQALEKYVLDNRTKEETLSLKLMRIYRLGEIIWYYTNTLNRSSGNLKVLNKKRIDFWAEVLRSVLEDTTLPKNIIEEYERTRDSLRSEEEKKRQVGLH